MKCARTKKRRNQTTVTIICLCTMKHSHIVIHTHKGLYTQSLTLTILWPCQQLSQHLSTSNCHMLLCKLSMMTVSAPLPVIWLYIYTCKILHIPAGYYCFPGECSVDQFQCATSGLCIQLSAVCDRTSNCLDGSDEQNCACKYPIISHFTCSISAHDYFN